MKDSDIPPVVLKALSRIPSKYRERCLQEARESIPESNQDFCWANILATLVRDNWFSDLNLPGNFIEQARHFYIEIMARDRRYRMMLETMPEPKATDLTHRLYSDVIARESAALLEEAEKAFKAVAPRGPVGI